MLLLSKHRNFDFVIKQLRENPQQFSSILFEIRCAIFCYNNFSFDVNSLEFHPSIRIENKTKNPDFKLNHPAIGKVFCECKSLISFNRIIFSRIFKFKDYILNKLSEIKIPDNIRIEIFYTKLPTHFNRNLGGQLAASINIAINLKTYNIPITLKFKNTNSPISYICIEKNYPIYFQDSSIIIGASFENNPKQVHRQTEQKILIIEKNSNISSLIKNQFKDAYTQLPKNKNTLVFIEPFGHPNNNDFKKINATINNSSLYLNMICCVIMYQKINNIKFLYPTVESKAKMQTLLKKYNLLEKREQV